MFIIFRKKSFEISQIEISLQLNSLISIIYIKKKKYNTRSAISFTIHIRTTSRNERNLSKISQILPL